MNMDKKTTKKVRIEWTKRSFPALWEEGGGWSNTGYAQIVAGPDGQPLLPYYIRRRGSLACGRHALLRIKPGTIVVEADHHREDFYISVWEVLSIENDEAKLGLVAKYDRGEWDHEPLPEKYQAAVKAAIEKATCYHCRAPHFVAPE